MRYKYIVWDFNGTLLDDLDASVQAVTEMLLRRGGPPMTKEWYHSLVEVPISRFYDKIEWLKDVPFDIIASEYNQGVVRHSSLIGLACGADDALRALKRAGCVQVIISSWEQSLIEGWLEKLGISGYFSSVLGADNLRAESKEARGAQWARTAGANAANAIMIGDTVHDWETAVAMGIGCILVCGGAQAKADLQECGVPVIQSLEQLMPLLAASGTTGGR